MGGANGGSGGGGGSCPAANPLSPSECAGAMGNCWSPGQPDTDCPNFGLCCFDGCADTCVDGPAPQRQEDSRPQFNPTSQPQYNPTTQRPRPQPIRTTPRRPIITTPRPIVTTPRPTPAETINEGYNYPVPENPLVLPSR